MSVAELVAKFSSAEADGVSAIAADIAAKVSSDGVPSMATNNLMDALKVRSHPSYTCYLLEVLSRSLTRSGTPSESACAAADIR